MKVKGTLAEHITGREGREKNSDSFPGPPPAQRGRGRKRGKRKPRALPANPISQDLVRT